MKWAPVAGGGTVTSVAAGNGLDFTTITGSGSVTMGTPDSLTAATSNAVTSTSHTHSVSGFLEDVVDDTTPQLGGDLDWNSNGTTLIGQTVAGSNGNAVYLSGSTTWTAADATAEATASDLIGIRVSATIVLTHGVYTTTGLTAGSIYYLSETTGLITTTKPTTSTSIVRVIGYALSTTELFVNPDQTWVENA
jgi:hypothetical protein